MLWVIILAAIVGSQSRAAAQDPGEGPRIIRESLRTAPAQALRAAYVVRPDLAGPWPLVVISHGRTDLSEDLRALADRLARRGYVALVRSPVSPMSRPDDLSELRAAVAFVGGRTWVDATRIGLVGFCGGGYQSLLLAAEAGDAVDAVASFYGPLTFPDRFQPPEGKPFRDLFEVLGEIRAAVQGHYGNSDSIIPTADALRLEETLRAERGQGEVFVYEGAEHGFCDRTHGHYDEEACGRAMERLFGFLDEHVAHRPG